MTSDRKNEFPSRRAALKLAGLASLQLALSRTLAHAVQPLEIVAKGNPIMPNPGVCDPQVRIYDGQIYLYATHDASFNSPDFVMNDWWVWHSSDLVRWEMVSVLKPELTYFRKPSNQCWATDAARRNGKYYFYFSIGPQEVGVVEGPGPAGPWHDPLGHALIAKGQVKTEARDPGILQESDGTSYLVFGTWNYYLARLNEDMISLAEAPKLIEIVNPEGPYGKGKTDDKPFLHRRGDWYYLSWGCFYGMSRSPYGPFDCKGSILQADRMDSEFLGANHTPDQQKKKDWLFDRHGSFFELNGQWYFMCNDRDLPGENSHFRNSVAAYVRYKDNGEIDPVRLTRTGVGQYDAALGIAATDFFKAEKAEVREDSEGRFQVQRLQDGSSLLFPKVRNLNGRRKLSISASAIASSGADILIHRGGEAGKLLGKLTFAPAAGDSVQTVELKGARGTEDLYLTFQGGPGELIRLNHLAFS